MIFEVYMRAKRALLVLILTVLSVLLLVVYAGETSDGVTVHYLNIGQGDAALALCEGRAVLFDAGTNESEEKLIAYLERYGVKTLDCLVLSHPHEDHIGGADAVIERFDVKNIIMPSVESSDRSYLDLLYAIDRAGLTVTEAHAGGEYSVGTVKLCILSPDRITGDANLDSAIVKLVYGETSFLFTGDCEGEAEEALIKNAGESLKSDVLKVGHHGSNNATSDRFLDVVSPSVAVISCGKKNDYGHPHPDVLARLSSRGIKIGRTDEGKTVTVFSDGKNVKIK